MDYYLFIDETGYPQFNAKEPASLFTLCGVIMEKPEYEVLCSRLDGIKKYIWNTKKISLHASSIAMKRNEFSIFNNPSLFSWFIRSMNQLIIETDFRILSCSIRKDQYPINNYPDPHKMYSTCLENITAMAIHFLSTTGDKNIKLKILIERRGEKEDTILNSAFDELIKNGNANWKPEEFTKFNPQIKFYYKSDNINGLQIADACAFPIARYHIDPSKPHPTFPYIEPKIYCFEDDCSSFGLKIFP